MCYDSNFRSIGKKLSSLLYTSGEDLDWSEMGLDKEEEEEYNRHQENVPDRDEDKKNKLRHHSTSPPPVREELGMEETPQPPEWASSGVQNWTQVIRQDAPKRAISSPVVTYTQRINSDDVENDKQQQPQVRRKSSELSSTMKSRLEAFNMQEGQSSGSNSMENESRQTTAGLIEPDQQFQKKLMAFRKISEGKLEQPQDMKPKPPISISSLLGGQQKNNCGSPLQSQDESSKSNFNNDEFETNTLDDVDQLLDEALEESYQSVLEDKIASDTPDSRQNEMVFSDHDFSNDRGRAPPMEKPPPPPPLHGERPEGATDDIDQQEREIIASLEMEEREHNKYIQEKMKRLPTPSSAVNTYDSGISSSSKPPSVKEPNSKMSASQLNHFRSESSSSNMKAPPSQNYKLEENNIKNQYSPHQQQSSIVAKPRRQPNDTR